MYKFDNVNEPTFQTSASHIYNHLKKKYGSSQEENYGDLVETFDRVLEKSLLYNARNIGVKLIMKGRDDFAEETFLIKYHLENFVKEKNDEIGYQDADKYISTLKPVIYQKNKYNNTIIV